MPLLTLAPLSLPGWMSAAAREAVENAPTLFLQTAEHPASDWVLQAGLAYVSMDDLYADCADFDALNAAIADRLCCGRDAVYAFPGGQPGDGLLQALRETAGMTGTAIRVLPGTDHIDAAMAALPDFPRDAGVRCAAAALPTPIDPSLPLCVRELDTPIRAGEVKLALGEYYPDEYPVTLCVWENGAYRTLDLPLYALDRQSAPCYFAATVLLVPPAAFLSRTRHGMEDLLEVMLRLRGPGGCPWDAKQTHATLREPLLEESYEVLQAIDDADADALCEELGDLLLQVVFHAQLESEKSAFTMRDVTTGIVNKLIYRHPHVFPPAETLSGMLDVRSASDVLVNWEALKKREKHFASQADVLDAVPRAMPALLRSAKVQKKAADVGFDWDDALPALDKVYEEADEVKAAMAPGKEAQLDEELGDLLFACVNAIRLLHRNPELLLQQATDKFSRRFRQMETLLTQEGRSLSDMTLAQMDDYWARVKKKS